MIRFSKIVSYVFHPILFSTIGSLAYFILSPGHIPKLQEYLIIAVIFVGTYLIPVLMLYTLKRFGLINNFELETIEERKFPLIFLIILTFMLGRIIMSIPGIELLAYSFYGSCGALLIAYILFTFRIKTSIHMMGIGSLIGFVVIMSLYYQMNFNLLLVFFVLIAGMLGTARLSLNAHNAFEVYFGFFLGLATQLMAYFILK